MSRFPAKKGKQVVTNIIHGPLKTYIRAGEASGAPPLGTQLGQRGINIPSFVKEFNERTKHYKPGVPLPSKVIVNPDRSYQLLISKPPFPYYLKQAAGINRGAMKPGHDVAGKVTLKHVYEIAKIKSEDLRYQASPMEEIVQEVLKSAWKCGIEVVRHLDAEEYGQFLKEREEIIAKERLEIQELKEAKMLRA